LSSLGNTTFELGIMVEAVMAVQFLETVAPCAANGTVMRQVFQAGLKAFETCPVIRLYATFQLRPKLLGSYLVVSVHLVYGWCRRHLHIWLWWFCHRSSYLATCTWNMYEERFPC